MDNWQIGIQNLKMYNLQIDNQNLQIDNVKYLPEKFQRFQRTKAAIV